MQPAEASRPAPRLLSISHLTVLEAAPPELVTAAADAGFDAYAAEIAAIRAEGLMRVLPGEALEHLFTLGFALDWEVVPKPAALAVALTTSGLIGIVFGSRPNFSSTAVFVNPAASTVT